MDVQFDGRHAQVHRAPEGRQGVFRRVRAVAAVRFDDDGGRGGGHIQNSWKTRPRSSGSGPAQVGAGRRRTIPGGYRGLSATIAGYREPSMAPDGPRSQTRQSGDWRSRGRLSRGRRGRCGCACCRAGRRRGRQVQLDAEFAQLLFRDLAGRAEEQVLAVLVEREGDDLADVRGVGQEHEDAVESGGDAAVRGRAEAEGVQQAAELLLDVRLGVAAELKGLVHDLRPVVADGAAGEFDAVADQIVLVGADLVGLGVQERVHAALAHGEGVVREVPALLFVAPLVHGEVDDPAELVALLLLEPEQFAEADADFAGDFVGDLLGVGREEHDVARLHVAELLQGVEFGGG